MYAPDFNNSNERHLGPAELEAELKRPSLLITCGLRARYKGATRHDVDTELMQQLLRTLSRRGNALLISDTASRVLEVLILMYTGFAKRDSPFRQYRCVLLGSQAAKLLNYAKSYLRLLQPELQREWDASGRNPFDVTSVIACTDDLELVRRDPKPKVVITGLQGLEAGAARELLIEWAPDAKNSIIFTGRPPPGTLGRRLYDSPPGHVDLVRRRRVLLEGIELQQHRQAVRRRQEEEAEAERVAREEAAAAAAAAAGEDVADEADAALLSRHDIMAAPKAAKTSGKYFKESSAFEPQMFPLADDGRLHWDDYGEIINREDYEVQGGETWGDAGEGARDMEVAEPVEERPSKSIEEAVRLKLTRNIFKIDLEGRVDGQSLKTILRTIRPRALVVVHGTKEDSAHLAQYYAECTGAGEVGRCEAPEVGKCVNVTSDQSIFQVRLTDALVRSLRFAAVPGADAEVAWVDGSLSAEGGGSAAAVPAGGDAAAVAMEIQTLSTMPADEVVGHTPVFVCEPRSAGANSKVSLRLNEFQKVLAADGIDSFFARGVLLCGDTVAIKREGMQLVVEGDVSELYYRVRELL